VSADGTPADSPAGAGPKRPKDVFEDAPPTSPGPAAPVLSPEIAESAGLPPTVDGPQPATWPLGEQAGAERDDSMIHESEDQEDGCGGSHAGEGGMRGVAARVLVERTRHLATIAKDPLRAGQRTGWGSIPLTDIPTIMAALSKAPPPPEPEAASEPPAVLDAVDDRASTPISATRQKESVSVTSAQDRTSPSGQRLSPGEPKGAAELAEPPSPARPQSRQRFKRVVEQSTLAWQLLGRMAEEPLTASENVDREQFSPASSLHGPPEQPSGVPAPQPASAAGPA
jgi:hypothetical protein